MKGQNPNSSKTNINWLFKMARRDGRASAKRLMLFMASIVLGIAAVVSIQSFSENLKENIGLRSKALMGADFRIDSKQAPNERVLRIIDSLGGADAKSIGFPSMAVFPKSGNTKLVSVKGIDGDYPFYGALKTKPVSAAVDYQKAGGALVDATLMMQYNLQPGDSIAIGTIVLPISGTLVSLPGSTGVSTAVAPPVLIPFRSIERTGLVQVGSRVGYDFYFVAKPDQDLEALDQTVDPLLDPENADLDTHTSAGARLGRRYENFGKFLNLVAFIALLLGCVGIASSVHIYVKEKLRSVAVLKCIGASRKQSFLIFLIQIAFMGLIGGLVGTLTGLLIQQSFPLLIQGFLPFEVQISYALEPMVMGLLLGLVMSILFALSPLLSTWYVSPLQVLRIQETQTRKSRRVSILVVLGILVFIYLFAFWLLKNWKYALSFALGILVVFALLSGFANLFMKGIKKYFRSGCRFIARQSLLNLFRPNNQTMVLILAIGVGTFLICTLYFSKDILLAKTSLEANSQSPNLILMDVQTEQQEAAAKGITDKGLTVLNNIPIVTMRMQKIKNRSVNDIRSDTASTINSWILNHEFRVTYRDSLTDSETLASGNWPSKSITEGIVPVSLSDNVARDAEVDIGDRLVFNVQGMLMQTEVASIRNVDWGQMRINFSVLFPSGVLENAPQFRVLTTHTPNESISAALQKDLVSKFPTVSILDLRQLLTVVDDILDKISWVINFMAFFSILTGIIVLVGSVRTSKYQRIKESVLLRTLGAKSTQILKITALEYGYLGILGSSIGIVLSLISSQLLAVFVFKTSFVPSWVPFLIFLPGITVLVLAIGLLNSRGVLKSPPLEVLRREGV